MSKKNGKGHAEKYTKRVCEIMGGIQAIEMLSKSALEAWKDVDYPGNDEVTPERALELENLIAGRSTALEVIAHACRGLQERIDDPL